MPILERATQAAWGIRTGEQSAVSFGREVRREEAAEIGRVTFLLADIVGHMLGVCARLGWLRVGGGKRPGLHVPTDSG